MRICVLLITILLSRIEDSIGSEKSYRPSFPEVFTVEIEVVFTQSTEIAATLYYDGPNNRTAVDILYQNVSTKNIVLFDEDEMLSITGVQCTVDNISTTDPENPLLSFLYNRETKEILPPEEIFHFQNSEFVRNDNKGFQLMYVYNGKTDIYGQKKCDVTHEFTTPEFNSANCDFGNCNSTLKSITLKCLNNEILCDDSSELCQLFQFFKFRDVIEDYEIFQPPKGIFCNKLKPTMFPSLPEYFSFSYDVLFRQTDIPTTAKGEHVEHHTLWYDGAVQVIRVDKFKDNGNMFEKIICDFKNGMIYKTQIGVQECVKSSMPKIVTLEKITMLPEIIFPWKSTKVNEEPIFVGERMFQGFEYAVWSSQSGTDSEIMFVRDFYFIKKYGEGVKSDSYTLQLAFIQQYEYGTDGLSRNFQLQEEKTFILNHFSTTPRELIEFDVSDCFYDEEKLPFEIELTGSLLSSTSNQFMQALFDELIMSSSVSVFRIGNLKIIYQMENKTSVTGVIMEILTKRASTSKKLVYQSEPDMKTTFNSLKSKVDKKKFSFSLTVNQNTPIFRATYFGEPRKYPVETSNGDDGYTGGAMAALAIVMLGIGAIIGGMGVFIYSKTRAKRDSNADFSLGTSE